MKSPGAERMVFLTKSVREVEHHPSSTLCSIVLEIFLAILYYSNLFTTRGQ